MSAPCLHHILTNDPSKVYQSIRKGKQASSTIIQELRVGSKSYIGDSVPDGFYESLTKLKTADYDDLQTTESFQTFSQDFDHIRKICDSGQSIPRISFEKTSEILHNTRPQVNDFFSITALHYLNGGQEAVDHLCFLINAIIDNVNNSSLPEVNTVFANILHLSLIHI